MRKLRLSFPAIMALVVVVAGIAILGAWHVISFGDAGGLDILFAVMFVSLAVTLFTAISHRDVLPNDPARLLLAPPTVGIVIPAYNEDPALMVAGLRSLLVQTLLPSLVLIVDDGSDVPIGDNPEVQETITRLQRAGVYAAVIRQENAGKRHAQARGWLHHASSQIKPDVWVTIDSDAILEKNAIRTLVAPFQYEDTMSVAGMIYGMNHRVNLLTRTIELSFVMSFINGRASDGWAGAVRVNSGALAAYRTEVIFKNLNRYLTQTFLGEVATTGDDRALTIFAREMGQTRFQGSAIAYTAHPVKFSHLIRQRLRWAKSWYWGTWWLLSRPVGKPEFWFTVAQVFGMVSYLVVMTTILVMVVVGAVSPWAIPAVFGFSSFMNLVSSIRYVTSGRTDLPVWDRVLTWLTAPLNTVLFMIVLNPLYYIAAFQLKKNGWGTRSQVEVEVTPAPEPALV